MPSDAVKLTGGSSQNNDEPDRARLHRVGPSLLERSAPADFRPERQPAEGRLQPDAAYLSGLLATLADRHQVPGAQLAVHHRGETTTAEVGELEHRTGRAVARDTAFPVGSITKFFTATLAMVLVSDGDVELDEPVRDHLPELAEWGDELTLRRVLSHTSGLASGPDPEEVAGKSLRRYLLDHCGPHDLVLPPGRGFSYSNAGYVVAGRLVEAVTGMDWEEAVTSVLLQPLGIKPVFIDATGSVTPGRPVATGHSVNTAVGRTRPVSQSLPPAERAAGALAASAVDLVALAGTHLGDGVPDLLPVSIAEQMRRPVPAAEPFGLADGWGLGLAAFRQGTTDWFGHDGNADGTACYFRVDPSGARAVALTTNANTGGGLWRDLLGELSRTEVPGGPVQTMPSLGVPVRPWAGAIGTYLNGKVEYLVTCGTDGSLILAIDGEATPLSCYSDLTFAAPDPITGRHVPGGRFLTDPDGGRIEGIQVNGRVARRVGRLARIVS